MPRLHLSGSKTNKGPGSALERVRNLHPRAPRRSISSTAAAGAATQARSSRNICENDHISSKETIKNAPLNNDSSDLDLFNFVEEFDYNEVKSPMINGPSGKKESPCAKFKNSFSSTKNESDKTQKSNSERAEKESLALSPSSTSSLSGSGTETLGDLSRKAKKNKLPPRRKRKSGGIDSISPAKRIVPTVSSRKITAANLSDIKNNIDGGQGPCKKQMNSNAGGGTSAVVKRRNNQNGENKVNDSSATHNKTTNGIRSRKKSSHTKPQQSRKKDISFDKQAESTYDVKKARSHSEGGASVYGKISKKTAAAKRPKLNAPQEYIDTDEEEENLRDTDEEQQESVEDNDILSVKLSSKSITNQRGRFVANNSAGRIQALPFRAIAIDNRALPTFLGDAMARHSFISHISQLIDSALEKGVLTSSSSIGRTIITALKCTTDEVSLSAPSSTRHQSVVAHSAFLNDWKNENSELATDPRRSEKRRDFISWLSDFMTPINHGFGHDGEPNETSRNCARNSNGPNGNDTGGQSVSLQCGAENDRQSHVPNGFSAKSSWDYFGSLGKSSVDITCYCVAFE